MNFLRKYGSSLFLLVVGLLIGVIAGYAHNPAAYTFW